MINLIKYYQELVERTTMLNIEKAILMDRFAMRRRGLGTGECDIGYNTYTQLHSTGYLGDTSDG